ncbi:MAG: hypothetical protein M3168_01570 [Actinomycetota bacterium]|nr:hypothetical protein [Actinomycetota bacterium]
MFSGVGESRIPALHLGEEPLDLLLRGAERRSGAREPALELLEPRLGLLHLLSKCFDLVQEFCKLGVPLVPELAGEVRDSAEERELKPVSQSVHAA